MLRIFKQYYPIRNAIFVLGEGMFIFISVVLASLLIIGRESLYIDYNIAKALLITAVCQTCLYYNDLYDLKVADSFTEIGIRLLQALGVSAIVLAAIYFFFPRCIIGQSIFTVSIAFVILLIVSWRFGYSHVLSSGLFNQKIIILGSSDIAKEIAREIQEKKDSGYEIAGIISTEKWPDCHIDKCELIVQNEFKQISAIARQKAIRKIIVALREKRGSLPIRELLECRVNGIEILEGNSFYEMLMGKLIVGEINPSWLIFSNGFQKSRIITFVKRAIDISISLVLLLLLSPIILLVAILIKLDSNGPAIFSQERVGQNYKPYMVHKFRSMRADAEKLSGPVWASENDPRITRVGHFIRKTRIDEIPQLWNVLKGDMSFVGPRPEREHFVKELAQLIPYYRERFTVKPGLTGWAQVSYGYGASVEDAMEKLNYDLFYIKNLSILMDLMIVARTVKIVLFGMGR